MKYLVKLAVSVLAAAWLAGCGTTGETTPEEGAAVEDRGTPAGVPSEAEGAQARGAAGPSTFAGHALDDPASPLSKRIIYFEFDSSSISEEYRELVQAHANYLASNPSAAVVMEGHADERGTREYNIALGEARAKAIRQLMLLQGAGAGQIELVSYGEERPAALGHDEAAWRLNRRVEIIYRVR